VIALTSTIKKYMHEKNDFAEVSKNLTSYRSENNFAGPSK